MKIFISYRRDDSAGWAGRVFDRLSTEFGAENCFMDVEGLQAGEVWDEALEREMRGANVALVVIGPNWFVSDPVTGLRRIDKPTDWVRREIETALASGATVIPLLVQGARSPRGEDLPETLASLARRETYTLDMRGFRQDLDRLLPRIQSLDPWRPFDPPAEPPMADHLWRNGLHIHWPITPESVLPWVPRGFDVDTFDGHAWLSADCVTLTSTAFRRTARLQGLIERAGRVADLIPGVGNAATFPIVNFKLMVSHRGKPGYLALYMTLPRTLPFVVARTITPFPYHRRRIQAARSGDTGRISMTGGSGPSLDVRYAARGETAIPRPETLESFLFNRYIAFGRKGTSERQPGMEMQYAPWGLQNAEITALKGNVIEAFDLESAGEPVAYATRRISATSWPIRWFGREHDGADD